MVEMRDATQEDVVQISNATLQRTGRTYAVEADGTLIAVAGYYFDHGRVVMYSMIAPIAKEKSAFYALDIVRSARRVIKEATAFGLPLFTASDETIPGSEKLLQYLGFQHQEGGIWLWPGLH